MTETQPPIYDVALIGGGIAGAAIARDAALRGMRVVLFEKNTFGSGTSSKTSKLIHGGIRYLETSWRALKRGDFAEAGKNFRFVFVALHETHVLARIAPDLIRPLPLIIPIYKEGGRNVWAVRFGALLYGLLALLTGSRHGPQILWTAKAVRARVPGLNPEGLAGGVLIWDHITDDVRLTQTVLRDARQRGVQAYEQTEVKTYRYEAEAQRYAIDVQQKNLTCTFYARVLINAGGPWVDEIRRRGGEPSENLIVPVAGSHIEVPAFMPASVILQAEDNRIFFVIRRGDRARVGTTERIQKNPDDLVTPAEDVTYLLRSLNRYFPDLKMTEKAILDRDTGIRPLARPRHALAPTDISREHEVYVGPAGVRHILGVKLTDHRRAAAQIVDAIVPLVRPWNPGIQSHSQTGHVPLT